MLTPPKFWPKPKLPIYSVHASASGSSGPGGIPRLLSKLNPSGQEYLQYMQSAALSKVIPFTQEHLRWISRSFPR